MEDWSERLVGLFLFSMLCGILLLVAVVAAELLHSTTDGRVPRLIGRHPPRLPAAWEEVDNEEEEVVEEIEEIECPAPSRQ